MAQHHRLSDCATSRRLIPADQSLFTPPPQARPKEPQGKLVQASRPPMRHYVHTQPQPTQTRQRPLEITDPRIQAKGSVCPCAAGHRRRGLADAAAAAPVHTMGCAAGLNRRRCTGRVLLRPMTSWSGTFSSLMPLGFRGQVWWVRARLATAIDAPGLSLDTIADQIRCGGIDFGIEQAAEPAISVRWRGCPSMRSCRPVAIWRSTRSCTPHPVSSYCPAGWPISVEPRTGAAGGVATPSDRSVRRSWAGGG